MKLTYKQTGRGIELKYDGKDRGNWFKVFGMTQNFFYRSFWGTDDNEGCTIDRDKVKEFLKLKVIEQDKNGTILEESNEIDIKVEDLETFGIAYIQSYHGSTLSIRSKKLYDLYRIYDMKGNMFIETKDVIVELGENISGEIRVDAFDKVGDEYVLKATSGFGAKFPDRKNIVVDKPKLTVIVPLYNSELFMCRTLDSILCSSLENIEVLLIDDGSTDKTGEIADRYEKNFGVVHTIHQENKGVAVARNLGLSKASGEYVAFCDNDDIVHPFMYEKLYNASKEQGTDIAIAMTKVVTDFDSYYWYPTVDAHPENIVLYSNEDMWKTRAVKGQNMFRAACWNRIVKTEVANLTKFPEDYTGPGVLYEDVAYTSSLYSYIDKFCFVRDAHYIRDKRKQKTVGTASTWHSEKEDNDYVWRMFIYAYSYPLYHRCEKNARRADYSYFKRLIDAYNKFRNSESELREHREEKLQEVIEHNKLYDNDLIMDVPGLAEVVDELRLYQ